MATIDQASIGTPVGLGTSSSTIAITTNVTIAANALIVIAAAFDSPPTTVNSVAGGSLSWAVDKVGVNPTSGDVIAICSAPAVAGLASGSTITATLSAASSSRMLGGMSILGADLTGSRIDGTPPAQNNQTGANWTSGSYTIAGGSIIVGATVWDINLSAAATAPTIEAWEVLEATGGNAAEQVYRIEAVGGSYVVAGTSGAGGGTPSTTIAVAYKAAAAAGGTPFAPHRMPLGC